MSPQVHGAISPIPITKRLSSRLAIAIDRPIDRSSGIDATFVMRNKFMGPAKFSPEKADGRVRNFRWRPRRILQVWVSTPPTNIDFQRKDINQLFVVAFLSRLDGLWCQHSTPLHFVSIYFQTQNVNIKKCGHIVLVNVCIFAKREMIG